MKKHDIRSHSDQFNKYKYPRKIYKSDKKFVLLSFDNKELKKSITDFLCENISISLKYNLDQEKNLPTITNKYLTDKLDVLFNDPELKAKNYHKLKEFSYKFMYHNILKKFLENNEQWFKQTVKEVLDDIENNNIKYTNDIILITKNKIHSEPNHNIINNKIYAEDLNKGIIIKNQYNKTHNQNITHITKTDNINSIPINKIHSHTIYNKAYNKTNELKYNNDINHINDHKTIFEKRYSAPTSTTNIINPKNANIIKIIKKYQDPKYLENKYKAYTTTPISKYNTKYDVKHDVKHDTKYNTHHNKTISYYSTKNNEPTSYKTLATPHDVNELQFNNNYNSNANNDAKLLGDDYDPSSIKFNSMD